MAKKKKFTTLDDRLPLKRYPPNGLMSPPPQPGVGMPMSAPLNVYPPKAIAPRSTKGPISHAPGNY